MNGPRHYRDNCRGGDSHTLSVLSIALFLCACAARAEEPSVAPIVLDPVVAGVTTVREPLDIRYRSADEVNVNFQNTDVVGIEQRQLTRSIRVRGWQVAQNVYFGSARVGERSGVGLVFDQGDTVIGLNHRGIQVRREF